MPKTTIYNQKGEKVGTALLSPTIFGVKEEPSLVHQVVVGQLASKRKVSASTKTRGEVRGGGRKPWRQKGTGRARASSIRSPLWRGGGVTFGPSLERSFKKRLPQKMRQKALFSVLSSKLKTHKIIMLDKIKFAKIKTKQTEEMLQKLPIKQGTMLVVLAEPEPKFLLSTANLPYLKVQKADLLNIIDLLEFDWLILTKDAVKKIEEKHLKAKKQEK